MDIAFARLLAALPAVVGLGILAAVVALALSQQANTCLPDSAPIARDCTFTD